MSEELLDSINSQLQYGDNRSAWVRDAIRLKLEITEEMGDRGEDMTDEERREFVVEAVQEAIESEGQT